ncbi:hypothetical protein H2200_005509 [Cladophialophora chaetospira]|uniref:Uncharacterized protein n=1 Tax=Cladophialophora chaetospira TaxID=386627 RepID=A0AA38XCC7_9EURO|nr:hypothetical protein H2200_005509 [Cladophialophora chaetospira]
MQVSFLTLLLTMLVAISATVLPVTVNEDSLHLAARDEDAGIFPPNRQGVANFSLVYDAPSDRCGSAVTTVVFNQLTEIKFSSECQAFYDYMTSIPNSSLKYSSKGVSLVYVCTSKKQPPTLPSDMGVADIKLVIYGPEKFPSRYLRTVSITLTVINAVADPMTNFTLPAYFDFDSVTQSDGSKKVALTSLHCS